MNTKITRKVETSKTVDASKIGEKNGYMTKKCLFTDEQLLLHHHLSKVSGRIFTEEFLKYLKNKLEVTNQDLSEMSGYQKRKRQNIKTILRSPERMQVSKVIGILSYLKQNLSPEKFEKIFKEFSCMIMCSLDFYETCKKNIIKSSKNKDVDK